MSAERVGVKLSGSKGTRSLLMGREYSVVHGRKKKSIEEVWRFADLGAVTWNSCNDEPDALLSNLMAG